MQKRIALWDNLKLFLVFLVVLGHLTIQYFDSSRMFGTMTMAMYTFHMPAFIFVSGLFSKHSIDSDRPPLKKAFGFIMLYFFVKILNYFSNIIFGVHISFEIFSIKDIPWYMAAMAMWYLLTWAVRKISPRYILISSVVLGCFAGYMKGDTDFLCILRLITFYPFFYSGYIADRGTVEAVTAKKGARIFSAVFFTAFTVVCTVTFYDSSQLFPLLSCRQKYANLGELYDWGALLRLAYYAIAALLVFSVISLCPRKELAISKFGGRTLQIYVWHRPILYIMKNAGLFHLIRQVGEGWEWIALLVIIALTALLCLRFWGVPLDYIMYPKPRELKNTCNTVK